jgi:hypothetical protein
MPNLIARAVMATILCLAGQIAFAQPPPQPLPAAEPSTQAAIADPVDLAQMSGGQAPSSSTIALTEQDLTAVNSGNHITADTFTTGSISLRDNAFANFNGVGNVIMNTGANNNIQSTLSVTVIMTPPSP